MLRKSAAIGLTGIALSLGLAASAQADPALPNLENLNFLQYTGSAPKAPFTSVDPVGWTGGNGLIYIDAPGTSNTSPVTACGPTYLQTYGCPSTLAIPGGYNEVEADGNPSFESGFNYTVTGLTPGQTYTLSFYQAGSQQTGFGNGKNTTEHSSLDPRAGDPAHPGGRCRGGLAGAGPHIVGVFDSCQYPLAFWPARMGDLDRRLSSLAPQPGRPARP